MNAKILGGVIAAMTALFAASGAAAQYWRDRGPVMLNPNFMTMYAPAVDCQVYNGVNIVIQNEGLVPAQAGTTIHWFLTSGASGNHVLATALQPGGFLLVENVVTWPVALGTICTANIV